MEAPRFWYHHKVFMLDPHSGASAVIREGYPTDLNIVYMNRIRRTVTAIMYVHPDHNGIEPVTVEVLSDTVNFGGGIISEGSLSGNYYIHGGAKNKHGNVIFGHDDLDLTTK